MHSNFEPDTYSHLNEDDTIIIIIIMVSTKYERNWRSVRQPWREVILNNPLFAHTGLKYKLLQAVEGGGWGAKKNVRDQLNSQILTIPIFLTDMTRMQALKIKTHYQELHPLCFCSTSLFNRKMLIVLKSLFHTGNKFIQGENKQTQKKR